MLDPSNQLHQSYQTYRKGEVTRLCHQIPKERREELVLKLQANQLLVGNGNKELLRQALKLLQ